MDKWGNWFSLALLAVVVVASIKILAVEYHEWLADREKKTDEVSEEALW